MSDGILTDLDELVQQVRDRTSRTYLNEAIAAYRAKAYRAAVVATWLAVVFDVISKLRELANQGDAQAAQDIQHIDNAIANNDIRAMQTIEQGMLEKAKAFELLTERETLDLSRLRDDRHHCAHPAFVQPGAMFAPSPDLVRSHIVHAANHLLRHPPVQGKAALARIKSDLLQPSFPTDRERAIAYFTTKYLNHVRTSLIEMLVTVFLKAIINQVDPDLRGKEEAMTHCLAAIARQHPVTYDQVLRQRLRDFTADANDPALLRVFAILATDPQCWNRLEEPVRLRMTAMIDQLGRDGEVPPEQVGAATSLLNGLVVPELRDPIMRLFRRLSTSVQAEFIARNPKPELADVAISLFAEARSFRGAEALCTTVILPMARVFSPQDIARTLEAAENNGQIWNAGGMDERFARLFDDTAHHRAATAPAWNRFLQFVTGHQYAYDDLRARMTEAGGLAPPPVAAPAPAQAAPAGGGG